MKLHERTANRDWVMAGVLGLVSAAFANTAGAQAIEEIVVTASKRGEVAIQDIPFSIQAIDGGFLQESGALDFVDYFRQVPGLSVNDQGPGDKTYIIRGIQSSGAGTVGLYFDEIIVTGESSDSRGKQPDPKMFDIDRVEVLKGPQGTTFGSSSLSGTIRWLPNKPQYDAYEMAVGGGVRTLQESDDLGWQVDGVINIPVVEDKVAIRVAGLYLDKSGYLDNRFEDDANWEETKAIRAMLGWRIAADLELSAFGMFQDMNVGSRSFYNETTANLPLSSSLNGQRLPGKYYQASLTRGGHNENIDMYNFTLGLDKQWGTITATHSVFDRYTDTKRATSWASEILFGLPADENPAYLGNEKDREVASSEIRFASGWDGPFQILTGVFFQNEERFEVTTYVFTDPITGRTIDAEQAARRETDRSIEELAFFGEASWDITDRLTLTGGARWFDQQIDEQVNVITGYIFQPGGGLEDPLEFQFDDVILKGNLAFSATDDLLFFAQVAEGYRAGGANDQSPMAVTDVIIPAGFDSDSLVNYELGIKSSFLDNRLEVNSSIYYLDWTNIQLQLQAQNSQGLSFTYRGNGGAAEVTGVEVAVTAFPTEGLRLGATFNYMDAKLTEDMPPPQTGRKGDSIPYSPKTMGSLNARYERFLEGSQGLTGFVAGDWSYQGKSANQLRPGESSYREHESYSILNLRGGIETDNWSLVLSVDNALDADDVIVYAPDFGTGANLGTSFFPDNKVRPWPRSFAVTVRKTFF